MKKDDSAEAIHLFRIEIKKLRAFLRLLSLKLKKEDELKLPFKIKKMYKYAGKIRDRQLHRKRMKAAIKKGMKIPEDISLIGFADGVWSKRLTPSLSTVSQHGPEIGEAAAEMLIKRLESKEGEEPEYETRVIKTELRQRESTKKL